MKVFEIVNFNKELLQKLNELGINTSDFKNVELYNSYTKLKSDGLKVAYIVSYLSQEYEISERKVHYIVAKMEQEIG